MHQKQKTGSLQAVCSGVYSQVQQQINSHLAAGNICRWGISKWKHFLHTGVPLKTNHKNSCIFLILRGITLPFRSVNRTRTVSHTASERKRERVWHDWMHITLISWNLSPSLDICTCQKHNFCHCERTLTHIHPDIHTWVAPTETRIRIRE